MTVKRVQLKFLFIPILLLTLTSLGQSPRSEDVFRGRLDQDRLRPDKKIPDSVEVLSFEANLGQAPEEFLFLSRQASSVILLSPRKITLVPGATTPCPASENNCDRVDLTFPGAVAQTIEGINPIPARTHYLIGRDPNAWESDVVSFDKVRFTELYEGIDLVFYGNPANLEFDFILKPAADPASIQMAFEGASQLNINAAEKLEVVLSTGTIHLDRPVAYQEIGGTRRMVETRFSKLNDHKIGFHTGAYDASFPLIIDPVLAFSSFIGGSSEDFASAVAVDASGNTYVTGGTSSLNFPSSASSFSREKSGGQDVFVSKYSPQGVRLFSTFIGGMASDEGNDIAVDSMGNIYVCGTTSSTNFPTLQPMPTPAPGSPALQLQYGGGTSDGFLVKLNPTGSALVYSTFLGGNAADDANTVEVDTQKAAYVAGTTRSANFPIRNAIQNQRRGNNTSDAFVAKFPADGSGTLFSTFLGGNRDDFGQALAITPEGNILLTGVTRSTDFPTFNPVQAELAGNNNDVFITSLTGDGSGFVYSTYLGGSGVDTSFAIATDEEGNAYVTGDTAGGGFPVVNAAQSALAGASDVFVSKLNATGTELIFSTFLGGTSSESGRGIAVDAQGDVVVTGATGSSNFPAPGTLFRPPVGINAFLTRLHSTGSSILSGTYLGGIGTEIPTGLALDPAGNAQIVGAIDRPDLLTVRADQSNFGGQGVFRSGNGAQNWMGAGSGLMDRNIQTLAIFRQNPSILYAGAGNSGVFKTTNGGNSWEATGLTGTQILSLAVHPADPDIAFAGTLITVQKTTDGGENWEPVNVGLPVFGSFRTISIDPANPDIVYVGTAARGIFKTTNGGQRWRAINNGLDGPAQQVFSIAIDPKNSSRIFIGTQGAVYSSVNGGATWQRTSLRDVNTVAALIIDPVNSQTLYAGATSQFGNLVAKTTDSGLNWNAVPVEGVVSSLAIASDNRNTLYAGTLAAGVLKSTDGGTTWAPMNVGLNNLQVNRLVISPSNPATLFTATTSGGDGFFLKVEPTQFFYFAQVGDGTVGRIRFQTTLILVNTGPSTTAVVEFFNSSGEPLNVTLGDLGTSNRFQIPLGRGSSFSAQTPGDGAVRVGYARVTTSDHVGGTAVFTRSDASTGQIFYEAGVPASRALFNFSVLLDSLENKDSGLAVVNAVPSIEGHSPDTEVQLTLTDKDGNIIDEAPVDLPLSGHLAQFIREIYPEISEQVSEMQGLIRVTSDSPLTGISLRQRDDANPFPQSVPTLTPLPVLTSNNLHNIVYFPQIGDGLFMGSRFQTTLVLANTGSAGANVTAEFFDSSGTPLEVTLGSLGTASSFQIPVAGGRFVFLQTPGQGDIRIGYARLTSTSLGVEGTAIFTETATGQQDIILYEAGVPSAAPLREFSLFVDTLGDRNTALAMVNTEARTPQMMPTGDLGGLGMAPDPNQAEITLRLYDTAFTLLAERTMILGPTEHTAQFINQLFSDVAGIFEMQGVLTVESTRPLAALTLRQINDPLRSFPQEVPTLTTFPVIPGRAK